MAKLSELFDEAGLASDTAQLRSEYATPEQPGAMAEAQAADVGGISQFGSDIAHGNVLSLLKTLGPIIGPIIIQALITHQGAPPGSGMARRGMASGVGSLLGYLFGEGAVPQMEGKEPTVTPEGALVATASGPIGEAASGAMGAMAGRASGLTPARAEYASALEAESGKLGERTAQATRQATEAEQRDIAKAQVEHATAQDRFNKEVVENRSDLLSQAEKELTGEAKAKTGEAAKTQEDRVAARVNEALGPKFEPEEDVKAVTLDKLTQPTDPVKSSTLTGMQQVFNGVSAKYKEALRPVGHLPVQSSLAEAIDIITGDMQGEGKTVPPSLIKKMNEAAGILEEETAGRGLKVPDPLSSEGLATALRRIPGVGRGGGIEDFLSQQAAEPTPRGSDTIQTHLGKRDEFMDLMRSSKDATTKRAAARFIDAIDADIERVAPDRLHPDLAVVRKSWRQAKSTFNNAFKSRLFHAGGPEEVAQQILKGATLNPRRAQLLVGQIAREAPEDLPSVRMSTASYLRKSLESGSTKEVEAIPPSIFRALWPDSGFKSGKDMVSAFRNIETFDAQVTTPEIQARANQLAQQGAKSLGLKKAEIALEAAKRNLRQLPDKKWYMDEALKDTFTHRVEGIERQYPSTEADVRGLAEKAAIDPQKGVGQPVLGGGFERYMKHRILYHMMASTFLLGSAAHGSALGHPGVAIGLSAYLLSGAGWDMALSNPTWARTYYRALTSQNAQQAYYWSGRLAASVLSQGAQAAEPVAEDVVGELQRLSR